MLLESSFAASMMKNLFIGPHRSEDEDERTGRIWCAGSDHYGMAVRAAIHQPIIASELLHGRSNVALKGRLLSGRFSRYASSKKGDE